MTNKTNQNFRPDGGWGYIISVAVVLTNVVFFGTWAAGGLIFESFLSNVGSGINELVLANAFFGSLGNIISVAVIPLTQKYSYRIIAMVGAFIYALASFLTIFVQDSIQFIIFFGCLRGIGWGIMQPINLSILHVYFDKKLSLINSVTSCAFSIILALIPAIIKFLLNNYGFKGTLAVVAAFSLNNFVVAATFQPVEWHQKKNCVQTTEPFLKNEKPTNDNKKTWKYVIDLFNLTLFKDIVFINIVMGISLAFVTTMTFYASAPLLLRKSGLDRNQTTYFMTIFLFSEIIGKFSLILFDCFYKNQMKHWHRYLFLFGSLFSAIFRIAFSFEFGFLWKIVTISILGFLRSYIIVTFPLIIAQQFPNNFTNVISLCRMMAGITNIVYGLIISFARMLANDNDVVVYLLSLADFIYVITWVAELSCKKIPQT